jgi:hypothetical protein
MSHPALNCFIGESNFNQILSQEKGKLQPKGRSFFVGKIKPTEKEGDSVSLPNGEEIIL